MSGFPPGPGEGDATSGGMNALLAQLRGGSAQQDKRINLEPAYGYYNTGNFYGQEAPQHQGYPPHAQQSHSYQPASVSSPLPTPPIVNQQPHHSSAVLSPAETAQSRSSMSNPNAGRTTLLNLLKFQQPSPNSPKQPDPIGTPLPPSREASMHLHSPEAFGHTSSPPAFARQGSDLLAALMGSMPSQASPQFPVAQPSHSPFASTSSPSAETQSYLLQLLNQPKPAQSDNTPHHKPAKVLTPLSKQSSQADVDDLTQTFNDSNLMGSSAAEGILFAAKENTREEPSKAQGLFTYVNPFDQLAASSPRVRTPKNPAAAGGSSSSAAIQILKRQSDTLDHKRKLDERSNKSSPPLSHSKRKLGAPSQASSSPPTPLPDGRTQLEALIGIGASGNKQTVSDALSEVGGQADKELQEALVRAEHDENQARIEKDLHDMLASKTDSEFKDNAQVAAKSIKKELDKAENSHALHDLPTPVAELVKDIVDDAAQGHIADSWESADAEDTPIKDEEELAVKVYNFPMKPFTSITIKPTEEPRSTFRAEVVVDIARLKKEFDQVDRTLVTASNNFIVYGMSKNGGARVIRQDDGRDSRLFTETHDRVFSVVVSVSKAQAKEAILATGISGTVYWSLIKDGAGDYLDEDSLESHGFALPPIQTADNDAPGGVLKTRARKSSLHPEFFAVGRGKVIHIIWPSVIMKSYLKHGKDRIVDTDKYLAHYSLKVNTGKAGKDFTFSEDDSTIVSLDKAGRVKFWDIRGLTKIDDRGRPAPDSKHMEIKEPVVTLNTTSVTEKAWPTSVLLVDKLRPYQKGGALRYLIVGMKQNHSLQLWDLGLGKPVQEINLPHSKESDAVCSILYNAVTGMIIIGHPTRNSIYFLHLSAPKYNLSKSVTQAEYMRKLAEGDPAFPKPESTAVISGMREYSFDNKGSLRSLDILQKPTQIPSAGQPPTLFELYAMHSKGVVCINIKQAELGWASDNKVINPVSANDESVVHMESLKEIIKELPPKPETIDQSAFTRVMPRPAAKEVTPKETPKKTHHAHPEPASSSKADEKGDKKDLTANGATNSGNEKPEKKKRRKGTTTTTDACGSGSTSAQNAAATTSSNIVSKNGSVSKFVFPGIPQASAVAGAAQGLGDVNIKDSEARDPDDVKKIVADSLDALLAEIKSDRRAYTAVEKSNQEAILRLVSQTLTDNIEFTLHKVVSKNLEKTLLPTVSKTVVDAVNDQVKEQLGSTLSSHLSASIPKELQRALPDAIGRALQQPQLLKLMSESLAKSVAFNVEEQFDTTLRKVVIPAFEQLAVQTSRKVAMDVQREAEQQIDNLERQRRVDGVQIEQLMQLVTGLTETVSSMAAAQTEFQAQFLIIQQQLASEKRDSTRYGSGPTASVALSAPVQPGLQISRAKELQDAHNTIHSHMNAQNFVEGVVAWLQSGYIQELFQTYFSKYTPAFIRDMNVVVLLSVGSAVSEKLDDPLMMERLSYMEVILPALQAGINGANADDARTHVPRVVGTWIQRLEQLFLQITSINAQAPHLKQVQNLVTISKRIIETATPLAQPPVNYFGSLMTTNPGPNQGRRY